MRSCHLSRERQSALTPGPKTQPGIGFSYGFDMVYMVYDIVFDRSKIVYMMLYMVVIWFYMDFVGAEDLLKWDRHENIVSTESDGKSSC